MISIAKNRLLLNFIAGLTLGVAYSFIFPLLGPRYIHFIPLFSFLHSLGLGLVSGFLFLIGGKLSHRFDNQIYWLIPSLLIGAHFCGWLIINSIFSEFTASIRLTGSLSLALFLSGVIITLGLLLDRKQTIGQAVNVLLITVVFLVVIKFVLISYLPVHMVNGWVIKDHPGLHSNSLNSLKTLYPLSLPLEKTLTTFSPLMPEIPQGPKIVTVVLDAFREDYFGAVKEGVPLTPNMSNFARENHYFSNYYVQSNWTKPSVASFFTGKYVSQHRVFKGGGQGQLGRNNQVTETRYSGHVLPDRYNTLAERLSTIGFKNAAYVSIPHISRTFKFDQGFDQYETSGLREVREVFYSFRSILFWILREQPKKSFIYLHLQGPHFNYREGSLFNPEFWKETGYGTVDKIKQNWTLPNLNKLIEQKYEPIDSLKHQNSVRDLRMAYASDVNYYDRKIFPRIQNTLESLGMLDDSFFVLTSDHGENLYDHQQYFGHLKYLHEEIINVPLLVKFPKREAVPEPHPLENDTNKIETIDLTATMLDFAGADTSNITGHSFLDPSESAVGLTYSLSEETNEDHVRTTVINRSNWKYVLNYQTKNSSLYNLQEDPRERVPVTNRSDLSEELENLIKSDLGSDSRLSKPFPSIKTLSPDQGDKLHGLGYL